jgi:hypothetical protein
MKMFVAIVIACIFSMTTAITIDAGCNAKIQQFRDCNQKIRDQRESEQKTKEQAMKACFTSNSCSPPGEGGQRDPKKEQCFKDVELNLKTKVETCVKGKIQGLVFPQDNKPHEEHRGGPRGGHGDKGLEQACNNNAGNVAKVKTCIQSARGPQSTPDQERLRFDSNCKARTQCDAILDANCKSSLEAAKQAVCQCGQQIHADATSRAAVFSSTPSCQGISAPTPRQGGQGGQQKSCDDSGKKDYCKLGFEAWQADKKSKQGGGH